MRQGFDEALKQAIREVEAGAEIERVLAKYPAHARDLRAHLEVLASLRSAPLAQTETPGYARGLARLKSALLSREYSEGGVNMNGLSTAGGTALKFAGAFALVAAVALGVAFLTGNLHVDVGSEAQASHTHACLDQVLGNLDANADGHFDIQDLLAYRDAFHDQNTDPRYDKDTDGDVDIDDVMIYIQELKACFASSFGPPGGA